jgi:hypothetical protein
VNIVQSRLCVIPLKQCDAGPPFNGWPTRSFLLSNPLLDPLVKRPFQKVVNASLPTVLSVFCRRFVEVCRSFVGATRQNVKFRVRDMKMYQFGISLSQSYDRELQRQRCKNMQRQSMYIA